VALAGDVASVGLEEVFAFLTANDLRGVLTVEGTSAAAFRLYFEDGRIFVPASDREGMRALSKVLEPDGVVARAWKGILSELRKRSDRLRRASVAELETRRRRYTEEIHALFLWDEARFEFRPGALPPGVEADRRAGRGAFLEPQAILMEVARRSDERQRIRRAIPSGRVILTMTPGAEERVAAGLEDVDVDLAGAPIDGTRPLDALLHRWLAPQYEVLARIAGLVEAGDLAPLAPRRARHRFRGCLEADDLRGAAQVLEHLSEIEATPPGQVLDLEPALVNSKAFRTGKDVACRLRLDGHRVFALVRELLDAATPFALVLEAGRARKRVSLLPGVLTVSADAPTGRVPPLEHYLARITKRPVEELEALRAEHGTLLGQLSTPALEQGVLEKLVDELAELVFWDRASAELANRGARSEAPDALVLSLQAGGHAKLRAGLVRWSSIFAAVPGEDAVFVAGPGCERRDPASKFFARFGPLRNVGELRRRSGAGPLHFTRLVHQGLENGYLLRPSRRVLAAWIADVRGRSDHVLAYRLLRAAVAFGHESAFAVLLDEYRGRDLLPSGEPALAGELDGIGGLPAVLQSLREHRHTGTLAVKAARRGEERVFFQGGELYLLDRQGDEDAEFLELVLGQEGAGEALARAEEVAEDELDPALVRRLKDRFLEVLFWEEASFAFHANDLPVDFFDPSPRVTKIALHTHEFLLEAVQIMGEWDRIRRVLPHDRSVLRFAATGRKARALEEHQECAEALMLIDGRLSFEDLVRRAGERRLAIGRVIAALVEAGELEVASNGGRGQAPPRSDREFE